MKIVQSPKEMQSLSEQWRLQRKIISFVPTMGYFHEGHLTLMREGKKLGDVLVVSLFVNPTQFCEGEDYHTYPRDLDLDTRKAEEVGVDVFFMPSPEEIYPEGFQTYVSTEKVSMNLCGIFRPGHFKGVTTVVAKLFNIVKPHKAIFCNKDLQQLITIKRMVKDLNFDVEIIGIPTVRDKDGLALSSRNSYLNQEERKAALSINLALKKAEQMFRMGERDSRTIITAVEKILKQEKLLKIEYVKICDMEEICDIDRLSPGNFIALAVRIGKARLIDNLIFSLGKEDVVHPKVWTR